MIFGHPALGLLARLKLKALARHQVRRLKKPSGILFGLVGLLLVGFWITSLLVGRSITSAGFAPPSGPGLLAFVQVGTFVVGMMTLFGALNHRGLYLPKEEIERLFSAPVSRADLVRYRLTTNLVRSLFAGLVFALLSFGKLPSRGFGFVGIMLTMLTLPLIGQAASLVLGDAENRLGKLLSGRWTKVMQGFAFAAMWLVIMSLVFSERLFEAEPIDGDPVAAWLELPRTVVEHPWMRALLLPTKPWALLITAADWATFGTWLAICSVTWLVLFEGTARIPIDYRELSLETSADVARRLNRMSKGGFGAGSGKASKRTAGWEVPWIFGRGRFGAVCWLKLGSILRKARGTVLVSALTVGALTLVFSRLFAGRDMQSALSGAGMIAGLGTFYLCAGLKFDFRSDLEQMETIKSWPVPPARIFLATILPEVVLVSGVLSVAILIRALATQNFHPALLGIVALLPVATLAWVALDNAVFLFAPVRYVPGQEGALHHMGRSLVLMLLRMLLLTLSVAMAAAPAIGMWFLGTELLDLSRALSMTLAGVIAWCVLLCVDVALVWLGGRAFRRFDVGQLTL